jgi:hypothetical protein
MTMEGGCFCGAVRYRIEGAPRRVTHCHCLHCRRTSGAPFLTWVEVHPERFTYTLGAPGSYESRPLVTREFCSRCGTQLTYRHAEEPDTLDVTACSLDVPDALVPEDHIWCERMLPWIKPEDGLPRFGLSRENG